MRTRRGGSLRALLAGSLLFGSVAVASVVGRSLPVGATTVVQTIGVGSNPDGISSDGTRVWVTNEGSNTVSELDASDGTVVQTIGVGSNPIHISSDGTHVWVTDGSDHVSEIGGLSFAILLPSPPTLVITPGMAYSPVTLQAANVGISASPFTTTLRWKKVSLPKGMELSSAGVLSGTPNKRLAAGSSSITVQVTETVTALNGIRKVKTPTTVEATIPLNIR